MLKIIMLERIKEGFFFGIGLFLFIGVVFGIVFAVGFHTPDEILPGTFNGDYVFNGTLEVKDNFKLSNATTCDLPNEGSLKYEKGLIKVCDGLNWNEVGGTFTSSGIDDYTKLILHFDNSLTDSSFGNLGSIETGSITYDSGKFGNAAYFNPAGSNYIEFTSNNWNFGSEDFTIDFWVKTSSSIAGNYLIGNQLGADTSNAGWGVYNALTAGGLLNLGYCSGMNYGDLLATTPVNDNDWHHVAYVKGGVTHYLFIDGKLEDSDGIPGVIVNFATDKFSIGLAHPSIPSTFVGYIDEFRISKGIARWTSNFVMPTEPYS